MCELLIVLWLCLVGVSVVCLAIVDYCAVVGWCGCSCVVGLLVDWEIGYCVECYDRCVCEGVVE